MGEEFESLRDEFRKCAWDRITDVIRTHGVVRHQIESYDHWINVLLPYICSESSDCWSTTADGRTRHVIHFRNVHLMRPSQAEFDGFEKPITPHACRLRGCSYSSNLLIEAVHDVIHVEHDDADPKVVRRTTYPDILLARLPVMVNSAPCHLRNYDNGRSYECRHDQGGYFIINGVERVLIAQEKLRTNHPYVFQKSAGAGGNKTAMHLVGELRSCLETKMRSTSTLYVNATRNMGSTHLEMTVTLPFVTLAIPLLYIFQLLGVRRDAVLDCVVGGDGAMPELARLMTSVVDNAPADKSNDDIVEWIAKEGTKEPVERRVKYTQHILASELST